jgi:hypothetical protein
MRRPRGIVLVKIDPDTTAMDATQCGDCSSNSCSANAPVHYDSVQGWRIVSAAVAFFLLPSLLGIIGAACFHFSPLSRLFGALLGLAVGAAVARVLAPLLGGQKEN